METIMTDQIWLNIKKAKKILTQMSHLDNPMEAKNTDSDRLYKDELMLCLCGIPWPEIDKLTNKLSLIQDWRKALLDVILEENPRLNQSNIWTL